MSRLMFRRTTQTGNLFYGKNFSRQHGAIMLKVKIEKEPGKEAQIKSLKSENDVWYFDSDEEFE